MRKSVKVIFIALVSLACSIVLIFSVVIANLFVKGNLFPERKYAMTEVKTVPPEKIRPQPNKQEKPRTAKRAKSTSRSPKTGPRFAMALGTAADLGGAAISNDYMASAPGGGDSDENGDVDEKPSSRSIPQFSPPQSIRESETDASLRLSFCVDAGGKVYNIKTVAEQPQGKGLSQAGIAALSKTTFSPAKKNGKSVAFCGMEQPFEIKFRD